MEIKVETFTDTDARMVIDGTHPYFVNALRRTLIADVPKMAIEDVEFHLGPIRDSALGKEYESVTPLFDEMVAHRLSLIPIPTDLSLFTFREKCTCGGVGCPSCTIMYTLNKKGPCTVYSGDLEPLGGPKFRIKEDLIPVVKLAEGQAPLIYATAILGTGRQHAKWQAVSGAGYKYFPKVEVNGKKVTNGQAIADSCPVNILKWDGKRLEVVDEERCILCHACDRVAEDGAVKVSAQDEKFVFHFDTDGSITVYDALKHALNHLEELFSEFGQKLSTLVEE